MIIPIILFARQERPAFEHEDAFATWGQTIQQGAAASSGSNNDHVEVFGHTEMSRLRRQSLTQAQFPRALQPAGVDLPSNSAMRCLSGATISSTSAAVYRGVMYLGQFQSKATTLIKNSRSAIRRASGSANCWTSSGCCRASSTRAWPRILSRVRWG